MWLKRVTATAGKVDGHSTECRSSTQQQKYANVWATAAVHTSTYRSEIKHKMTGNVNENLSDSVTEEDNPTDTAQEEVIVEKKGLRSLATICMCLTVGGSRSVRSKHANFTQNDHGQAGI
ncbi:unnamed protein product [Pleuronectes platessa]|uniref:Uncharacterized protein n=1 Tax=Pleuronectes platessa TaxID=8262 RepID=A0A9N7V340_PLEPL|nr:unnamed protein product [Pleuronectes platessa]